MHKNQNLFLVGPMGAGKTTIGNYLAEELDFQFHDSDREVEKMTGVDLAWIYDVEGEDGFRLREAKVIEKLTKMRGIVLATGGGTILLPENRQFLAARGTVIYLQASLGQQLRRVEYDRNRPSLHNQDDREGTLKELCLERDPLYREIADYVFSTDDCNPRAVAQEILKILKRQLG